MTYEPQRKPWAHQAEALLRLEGQKAFALFMSMRTGKTKVLLDDFGRLELDGEVDDLLVIAPCGVYRTWETAIREHLSLQLLKEVRCFTWKTDQKEKAPLISFLADKSRPRIFLINVEALSTVKRAQAACVEFLSTRHSMVAVDESTVLKNPKAMRTVFITQKLAPLAKYRRILSGLPDPNSPLDLYSQFFFLDPRIFGCSYYMFRARYAITQQIHVPRKVTIVVGYRNLNHLSKTIEPYRYRKRLKDCYDVPEKIYTVRDVQMTKEQTRIYEEMKKKAFAQLSENEFITADLVIVQILRLHQILCGHVPSDSGGAQDIPELRTAELLNVIREYDGKAIIWCSYDADIRKVNGALEAEFGEGCSACFWGGNRGAREDEEKRFLTDPKCRFMVATPASGGRGRTWTIADLIVYYSNTPDLEHRSQSEERAQAIDRPTAVTYVDLAVPGTVDMKILSALQRKIKLSALVMSEEPEKWLEVDGEKK